MAKPITDEMKARIGQLIVDANDKENAGNRADLLDRYLGEPYGDEVDGRSKFIDTSTADAVEAILPEIMDVFTSAEHVVEFPPIGPDDEEAAKQETAVVRHIFWQQNNGFEILYTWLKEAMIQQNAYVWRGWVDREKTEIEEYEGLSLEEYLTVMSDLDDDYEILELSGLSFETDPATGMEIPVQEMDENGEPEEISTRIRCVEKEKRYLIEPFPQEDFFCTPRWGKVSLDGVPCCGRVHRNKTKEDWLAFGFSEASLSALTEPVTDTQETSARHYTQDLVESKENVKYLELYEAYVRVDLDGDGVDELIQVWCSEEAGVVMEWEDGGQAVTEVSSIPISAITPYIMPHRHIGRSVVENVDDIQRVKTVLMRQMLDAIYKTNYPRPVYDENMAGENLANDLAMPSPGAPIRTGGAMVEWTSPPQIVGQIVPLIEKFDSLQEVRTGATRYNQGLDAESLNKTASGINMILGASQKKAKLVARTFAETGMRDLFLGIHDDLRKGPVKEIAIKVRGQWISANPRLWRRRKDIQVNIGMGRGDRDEKRAGLMLIGQTQEKLIAAGSRMVDESKLFATMSDTLDTFGMMGAEKYFYDPQKLPPPPPPPPPPPDPIMLSAQAQAQKYAADAQLGAAKLQADEREKERQFQVRMQELRLKELELSNRIQNERETLDLKEKEAVMKDDLERDKLSTGGTPAVPYGQVTGSKD